MSKENREQYKQPLRWEPPTYWGFKCDGCGEHMDYDTITVSYGFGCDRDLSDDEHFCSYTCLAFRANNLDSGYGDANACFGGSMIHPLEPLLERDED